MRKAVRVAVLAIVLTSLLSFLAPQPAEACERCIIKFTCVIDECYLIEYCGAVGPPIIHYTSCQVYLSGCQEWGDTCLWA